MQGPEVGGGGCGLRCMLRQLAVRSPGRQLHNRVETACTKRRAAALAPTAVGFPFNPPAHEYPAVCAPRQLLCAARDELTQTTLCAARAGWFAFELRVRNPSALVNITMAPPNSAAFSYMDVFYTSTPVAPRDYYMAPDIALSSVFQVRRAGGRRCGRRRSSEGAIVGW